jgi:Family of unknown function (DUF5767)
VRVKIDTRPKKMQKTENTIRSRSPSLPPASLPPPPDVGLRMNQTNGHSRRGGDNTTASMIPLPPSSRDSVSPSKPRRHSSFMNDATDEKQQPDLPAVRRRTDRGAGQENEEHGSKKGSTPIVHATSERANVAAAFSAPADAPPPRTCIINSPQRIATRVVVPPSSLQQNNHNNMRRTATAASINRHPPPLYYHHANQQSSSLESAERMQRTNSVTVKDAADDDVVIDMPYVPSSSSYLVDERGGARYGTHHGAARGSGGRVWYNGGQDGSNAPISTTHLLQPEVFRSALNAHQQSPYIMHPPIADAVPRRGSPPSSHQNHYPVAADDAASYHNSYSSSKIPPPPLDRRAPNNISSSGPSAHAQYYRNMTSNQQSEARRRFLDKFLILQRSFPTWKIPLPSHDASLEHIHHIYESYVKQISIHSNSTQFKVFLVVMFVGIEFAATKWGVDLEGYASSQIRTIGRYDGVLLELGEKYCGSDGEPWSVEVRIFMVALIQAGIFFVSKYVEKWTGSAGIANVVRQNLDSFADSVPLGSNGEQEYDAQGLPIAPGTEAEISSLDCRAKQPNATLSDPLHRPQPPPSSRLPTPSATAPVMDIGGILGSLFSGAASAGGGATAGGGLDMANLVGTAMKFMANAQPPLQPSPASSPKSPNRQHQPANRSPLSSRRAGEPMSPSAVSSPPRSAPRRSPVYNM